MSKFFYVLTVIVTMLFTLPFFGLAIGLTMMVFGFRPEYCQAVFNFSYDFSILPFFLK